MERCDFGHATQNNLQFLSDPRDLESEWESKYTHLNLYWNGNNILNLGGVLNSFVWAENSMDSIVNTNNVSIGIQRDFLIYTMQYFMNCGWAGPAQPGNIFHAFTIFISLYWWMMMSIFNYFFLLLIHVTKIKFVINCFW